MAFSFVAADSRRGYMQEGYLEREYLMPKAKIGRGYVCDFSQLKSRDGKIFFLSSESCGLLNCHFSSQQYTVCFNAPYHRREPLRPRKVTGEEE